MDIKAILLKPLDGDPVGTPRTFDAADFKRLKEMGAVREAGAKDPAPPEADAKALLLEKLRHPSDGPALLDAMKASYEDLQRERDRLSDALSSAQNALRAAETARDQAVTERDAAKSALGQAETDRDAARAELAAATPEVPAEKPAKANTKGATA